MDYVSQPLLFLIDGEIWNKEGCLFSKAKIILLDLFEFLMQLKRIKKGNSIPIWSHLWFILFDYLFLSLIFIT